ncbi:MAG: DUF1501 domain-containing protein [Acidobacteriota bacterium]
MFRFDADKAVHFCDGFTRRDFLHAGSLGMLGFGLSHLLSLKAAGAVADDKDLNVIQLFLVGGPSQLDTWDMKPDAPLEIRGPYKPIKTNVPGIEISEIFPRMAKQADKYALVRSLYYTGPAVHDIGHQVMQTGRVFQGGVVSPNFGSVMGYKKGGRGAVPAHVLLPKPIGNTGGGLPHGQDAGFLGKTYDPFVLNADPSDPNFKVPDMLPPDYLASLRTDRRRNWREVIEQSIEGLESVPDARLYDSTFHQAYGLMTSARAREAFELDKELEKVRDSYGRNRFGQSCLLARRLIEAGVRFVTVNMFETVFDEITWDIHGSRPFSPISCYRDLVGPMFDNAFSSLIQDLDQRGILKNTLVLATGEFGRTPKVNPAGGRDHWPSCWSAIFAGGGVRGGQVIGSSDSIGGVPRDRPVSPAEVAATIYHLMGLDLETFLPAQLGRIVPLVDHSAQPIRELLV